MSEFCAVSPWTPERERRAVQLYLREGFSAAETAEALGAGISRAAVVNKLRRLGLRKSREARSAAQRRSTRRLHGPPKPCALPPLREASATGAPRTLTNLLPGACRWPIDDPGPGRMHLALFCGGHAPGGRYCAEHERLAWEAAA